MKIEKSVALVRPGNYGGYIAVPVAALPAFDGALCVEAEGYGSGKRYRVVADDRIEITIVGESEIADATPPEPAPAGTAELEAILAAPAPAEPTS